MEEVILETNGEIQLKAMKIKPKPRMYRHMAFPYLRAIRT
jgi:hypothetical protein